MIFLSVIDESRLTKISENMNKMKASSFSTYMYCYLVKETLDGLATLSMNEGMS